METLGSSYRAVVIGASGGIGQAVAGALSQDGRCAEVVMLSRSGDGLDITDEASVARAAASVKERFGAVDLIFDATGALAIDGVGPEKSLRGLDPQVMARQFAVNAIGPALLIKHFSPLLPRDRRAIFATLSARVGSIGDNRLGGWISYRSAKAALNQIVRTASVEIARTHPQAVLVSLHPGTVATSLTAPFRHGDATAPEVAARQLLAVMDGLPASASGQFFAYDSTPVDW